ncbi:hypothetical protein Q4506_00640 [Colwellia sp. 4_MG-2023]|uniref:hypothetical protein n=1 Tax=unclassified Colwellia TaxID=196834 RepID=UPI0026E22456|nr:MULTISPECIES: hypothetical protein [unclassified Colwellia]MDO6505542.1 hypothetical protein [Colwellia sp. 5_MG-2023]MDO6554162.1 hypothetical protein [Colwellia sp. 4_MG-2023]
MKKMDLPISDASQEGRKNYIESNRFAVEYVIAEALEVFQKEDVISKVFRSQDKAIEKIIEMFLSPHFSLNSTPYKDIRLFSQLNFWVNYKTRGRFNVSSSNRVESNSMKEHVKPENEVASYYKEITKILPEFNRRVAADVIKYWFKANKKLLNELLPSESTGMSTNIFEVENKVSDSQDSRYKVDAAFRYLFLYFGIDKQIETAGHYERKYLTKGENKPQYVSGIRETHQDKHHVRLSIKNIIDQFFEIHKKSDNSDILSHSLLKVIGRKAVLDVYEINSKSGDKDVVNEYNYKLSSLKKRSNFIKEEA